MLKLSFARNKTRADNPLITTEDGPCIVPIRLRLYRLGVDATAGATVVAARGKMPATDNEALAMINAGRSGEPLTADDVHIKYAEAANNNFIPDRYMFMDTSTLKNIAQDAHDGFAFMNSHRTGTWLTPADLPFGKTFCGRYEMSKQPDQDTRSERALVGFYMSKGIAPNGTNGPTTDDMARMIDDGTLFDGSVGLYGGQPLCDVCGNDIDEYISGTEDENGNWISGHYSCPHIPGTTLRMNADEIATQIACGVPDGCCSFTLVDAHCGELSGVYDGAVPGAGFLGAVYRKLMALSESGQLTPAATVQARHVYRSFLTKGDLPTMDEEEVVVDSLARRLAARLGISPRREITAPAHSAPRPESETARVDPRIAALDAAGIQNLQQLKNLQQLAEYGTIWVAELRVEAKRQAVVAFGQETAEGQLQIAQAHALIDASSPDLVKAATSQYTAIAVSKGLQAADGKPKERQTARSASAVDFSKVGNEGEPTKPAALTHSDIYANRAKQQNRA